MIKLNILMVRFRFLIQYFFLELYTFYRNSRTPLYRHPYRKVPESWSKFNDQFFSPQKIRPFHSRLEQKKINPVENSEFWSGQRRGVESHRVLDKRCKRFGIRVWPGLKAEKERMKVSSRRRCLLCTRGWATAEALSLWTPGDCPRSRNLSHNPLLSQPPSPRRLPHPRSHLIIGFVENRTPRRIILLLPRRFSSSSYSSCSSSWSRWCCAAARRWEEKRASVIPLSSRKLAFGLPPLQISRRTRRAVPFTLPTWELGDILPFRHSCWRDEPSDDDTPPRNGLSRKLFEPRAKRKSRKYTIMSANGERSWN